MQTTESSTSPPTTLPASWVAKIFATMQGHYGSRWLNLWKIGQTLPDGTDAGVKNAMAVWGEKLAGFIDQPERLKYTLENALPTDPPSLPRFIELLRQAPTSNPMMALEHRQTQEEIERSRETARALKTATEGRDHMQWAKRPRSQIALDYAFKASKRVPAIKDILSVLIEKCICTESGTLIHKWDGKDWRKVA